MSDPRPEWLDLTDDQLRDEVVAIGEQESGLTRGPAAGFFATTFETMAMMVQRVFRVGIRPVAEHADPRVAGAFFLRLHGMNAAAFFRSTARAANGYLSVASATGGRMRAGTAFTAADQAFTTDLEIRLAAGVAASVPITASVAGDAGNVAPGAVVEFDGTPIPADATATLPAQWITTYGFDADTDDPIGRERYRARVIAGFAVRGEANTLARYRLAALGVGKVSSVSAGRAPRGYGSADISILEEGRLPSLIRIEAVRAAIAAEGLVGRDVRVTAPMVVSVAVNVSITGRASLTATEDAIGAWWRANVGIGDGVLVQSLYASAHLGVAGIESIVYSSPASNLLPAVNRWYQPSITVTRA